LENVRHSLQTLLFKEPHFLLPLFCVPDAWAASASWRGGFVTCSMRVVCDAVLGLCSILRGGIQKFPDWVCNEIYA
jgi:hypothetical protein